MDLKVKLGIRFESKRFYNDIEKQWHEFSTDDFVKVMMSTFEIKKISIVAKGYDWTVDTEMETSLGTDIVKALQQSMGKTYKVTAKFTIIGQSYSSKEMAKLKKVVTFDKVFKDSK